MHGLDPPRHRQPLLVSVAGGDDFSLSEYEEVVKIITANADNDALIIPGTVLDESLEDELQAILHAFRSVERRFGSADE